MSKIKVLYMTEGWGFYTKGTKDKEAAVKAMRAEADREFAVYEKLDHCDWGDDFKFQPEEITSESVKATWYYQCRKCETETIGDDNICHECGEPCGTTGRRTFAFITENI